MLNSLLKRVWYTTVAPVFIHAVRHADMAEFKMSNHSSCSC